MSELRLNTVTDKDTNKGVNVDALHYQNTQLVRNLGTWKPGLVFENKTDYATYNDQAIVAGGGVTLPYTTQGSDPTDGPDAGIVVTFSEVTRSGVVLNVASISDLQAMDTSELVDGQQVQVKEYSEGSSVGGGVFYWDSTRVSEYDGGVILNGWVRSDTVTLTPEMFGAVGDDITDDTVSFQLLSDYVNSVGGGNIKLGNNKIYRIGQQIFTGSADGRAYREQPMIRFDGLDGLNIIGDGAVLRLNDGLRYGSFDPITGEPHHPDPGRFTNSNYAAVVGHIVYITNSKNINISGLEIDGNQDNLIVGGYWGDTGIQLRAVGLTLIYVSDVSLTNVRTYNNGLDGLYLRGKGTEKHGAVPDNISIVNLTSDRNGRQGCSVTGGSNIQFSNCAFTNTAQGPIGSLPRAGVDLEPNGADWCTRITFSGCYFENNRTNGIVTDGSNTRDVVIRDCEFWEGFSGSGDAFWLMVKGVVVDNCKVHGCVTNIHPDTVLFNTHFDNDVHPIHGRSAQSRTRVVTNGGGTWRSCSISSSNKKLFDIDNYTNFFDCKFHFSGALENRDWVGIFKRKVTLSKCTFSDDVEDLTHSYYYSVSNAKILDYVEVKGPNVRWSSWSGSGDPRIGIIPSNVPGAQRHLNLHTSKDTVTRKIMYSTEAPTTGHHRRGDLIFNSSPTAGGDIGWTCVASGEPGTWKSFGVITS